MSLLTATQEAVWGLREEGLTQQEIATRLGLSRRTIRDHLKAIKKKLPDQATSEVMTKFNLETIPDMIWYKDRHHSVKVSPRRLIQLTMMELAQEALQNIPAIKPVKRETSTVDPDLMAVYPIFDAHIGMLAHATISGEDIDLKSGAARVTTALRKAMDALPDAARGVIILGGDLTHQTDDMNKTRRSGHQLDVASRNVFTVMEGFEVVCGAIEYGLLKHETLEVYGVPGNHDPQNWETIMLMLRERYRKEPRVIINVTFENGNTSAEFDVVEHGEVAIFIHHGDKRTPKDLSMFVAAEFPEVWGRTKYRILLTGHLNHLKLDEYPGIYWMQMPALAARDHHAAGGYRSHSLLKAMCFDKELETDVKTVKV